MYGGNFDGAGVLARRVLGFSAVLHRSRCIRAISSRRNGICTCRRYFLSFSDVGLFSNSASAANICFLQYIQRLALAPLLKDKEPREVLIESQFALQTLSIKQFCYVQDVQSIYISIFQLRPTTSLHFIHKHCEYQSLE